MGDSLNNDLYISPPLRGLMEGLDPALPDDLYPATFAADLQNVRCSNGKLETRLGMALWKNAPSSGSIRLLDTHYLAAGTRVRVLAQGEDNAAKFYKLKEGTDSSFVAVSGGTGLGTTTLTQPYFQGVTIGDRYYFVDRAGALRKYVDSGPAVSSVTNPATPGAAPGVKAWTYGILENWLGAAPHGWARTDATDFDITAPPGTLTSPMGNRAELSVLDDPNAAGDAVADNVANEAINSHTIAFWLQQTTAKRHVQFGFGLTQADEFTQILKPPEKDEWYPVFIQMADLPTISFKRFKCIKTSTTPAIYVSTLYLPGRLEGTYRWRYTHYNTTTLQESEPSAVSNSGAPMDFSAIGVSYNQESTKAFQKSAMMTFTTDDSGATTNKIRIYRSGGLPELTQDSRSRPVWIRVGEVFDVSTTLSAGPSAGDTSITVTSATNIAVGDWIVIDKGNTDEEYVKVTSIAGAPTLTIEGRNSASGLIYAHANLDAVQIAFLDNVPNEQINVLADIDEERDDPPSAAKWVRRAPDGRLWLLNYSGKPTGVRVSNKPTPERPFDYEVFPDDVDPVSRVSATQGFGFEIGGDTTDEEIVWGDFVRERMHIFTRRHLYVVDALSQLDWGPNAVYKALDIGCIAGDTVQVIGDALYWVAPGPKVMRWDGQSAPEDISHQRLTRLKSATTTYWNSWFARSWENEWGRYYRLYYWPSGVDGNITILDYNITQDSLEPVKYYDALGSPRAWQAATNFDSTTDTFDLYQADSMGGIYQTEVGSNDAGIAIQILAKSKRFALGAVSLMKEMYLRLTGATDTVTVQTTVGGGEYSQLSKSYTISLAGTNDTEVKQRLDRSLKGRWFEVQISGAVSNRPAIREMKMVYQSWREGRQKP